MEGHLSGCSVASGAGRCADGDSGDDAIVIIQATYDGGLESASGDEMEAFEIYFGGRLENVFTHTRARRPFGLSACSTPASQQVTLLTACWSLVLCKDLLRHGLHRWGLALSPSNSASRVSLSFQGTVGRAEFFRCWQPAVNLSGRAGVELEGALLGVWTDPQHLPCFPPLLSLLPPPPSRSHLNCLPWPSSLCPL